MLLLLGVLAGCDQSFAISPGVLLCSTDKRCPVGNYCAADGHCYPNGYNPDLAPTDGPPADATDASGD